MLMLPKLNPPSSISLLQTVWGSHCTWYWMLLLHLMNKRVSPPSPPSTPQLSLVFNNLQFRNILFTCCNHNWDTLTWSLLKHLSCCINIFSRGPQTSQKSRSHLQIPGARGLTCSKFHIKHSWFWSDPWLNALWHFLLGACVVIHIFACKEKWAVMLLKILVAIIHNLVNRGPGHLGFVHPWSSDMISHNTIQSEQKAHGVNVARISNRQGNVQAFTALSNHLISFWSFWTL